MAAKIVRLLFGDFQDVMTPTLRRLFLGNFLSSLGTGMTLALLLVYLKDIRGFTTSFGGFLLSFMALISILFGGPVGWLIDRIGPKKVIIAGLLLEGSAVALVDSDNTARSNLDCGDEFAWNSDDLAATDCVDYSDESRERSTASFWS